MKRGLRHALAVAVAALSVMAAAPASAHAATPTPMAGWSYANTIGLPHSMKEGRAYYAHTWYRQTSKYTLVNLAAELTIWTSTNTQRGVSVDWLNPATHRWQHAQYQYFGFYELNSADGSWLALVPPGKWARLDFRITFTTAAKTGTWHVMPVVPAAYGLLNSQGRGVDAGLRQGAYQQFAFKVYR
ncbi:hypothetical protein [Streptacidiphilus monticola]|uniref:DUF1349 domain-containing protein n=1 Tax=Streptacidiphilus monticola TaxID=2161674 RepID=A0ABW1G9X5_9ACTN